MYTQRKPPHSTLTPALAFFVYTEEAKGKRTPQQWLNQKLNLKLLQNFLRLREGLVEVLMVVCLFTESLLINHKDSAGNSFCKKITEQLKFVFD